MRLVTGSSFSRPAFVAAAGLTLAGLTSVGCSSDTHTYRSTHLVPKTVGIVYLDSGETAWSMDVPAGENLTLEFDRKGQIDGFRTPATPATSMSWYTTPLHARAGWDGTPSRGKSVDHGSVDFNGMPIKIEVAVREPDSSNQLPVADPALRVDPIDAPPPPPPADLESSETGSDDVPAPEFDADTESAADDMDAALDFEETTGGAETTMDDVLREAGEDAEATGDEMLEVLDEGLSPGSDPVLDADK